MIVVRLLLTALLVIGAVLGLRYVWVEYFEAPWTRDATVRADVVEVSSYVMGEITQIHVSENTYVRMGDPLLSINPESFQIALRQAKADLRQAIAQQALEDQKADRLLALEEMGSSAVSDESVATQTLQAASAQAARLAAEQAVREAELRLKRTSVMSRVNGWVTNLTADTGDFVSEGSTIMALVDADSFRVEAYFMETKLPTIKDGASARVRLMSDGSVLQGRVQGIARGIYRPGMQPNMALESPEPSFQWIRLAQRIPVRIDLEKRPEDLGTLIAGQTASVIVDAGDHDSVLQDIGAAFADLWSKFQ